MKEYAEPVELGGGLRHSSACFPCFGTGAAQQEAEGGGCDDGEDEKDFGFHRGGIANGPASRGNAIAVS